MPVALTALLALVLSVLMVPTSATASTGDAEATAVPGAGDEDSDPFPDADAMAARYGELRFTVDPTVVPRIPEVEPIEGTREPRPVGAIAFPDGETSEFVLDEVLLHADDRDDLAAFLTRWGGTVLSSDEPDAEGQDHLVRVDPSAADVEALPANLRSVERFHAGEHRLSDQRALDLLALVAAEAAAGTRITMDWLSSADGIAESAATESPDLPANVFTWTYMAADSVQEIGVAQAWRALEAHGKLDASPRLMIADGGFVKNADFPPDVTLRKTSWGAKNPLMCGDKECVWHGTHSVMTAMAEIDNGYGTAGPAGPLNADAVVVGMAGSFWYDMDRLVDMVDEYRPDVVNMSFSARFKILVDANRDAAGRRFRKMQEDGALLVASAGNQGENVDDWILRLPCENGRVMCVGGMADDQTAVSGGSNYGTEDSVHSVEIYAPYCVHGLADPGQPYSNAAVQYGVCGTSEASPFVAGVAALVMAANPDLTQGEVRQVLRNTANLGGLGAKVTGSQRRVDALDAVASALGMPLPHPAPTVKIASPASGSQFSVGATIQFTATATDYIGRQVPVQWSSNRDGEFGAPVTGTLHWDKLSEGSHTITATATDDRGETSSKSIGVVVGHPATVTILSPTPGVPSFVLGRSVALVATSYDIDWAGPVPDKEAQWVVRNMATNQPVFAATGHKLRMPTDNLIPGYYLAQFSAGGSSTQRVFRVWVYQGEPTATIKVPTLEHDLVLTTDGPPRTVALMGEGKDLLQNDISGTRFRWVARSGATTKVLCTGSSVPGQGIGIIGVYKSCKNIYPELGLDGNVVGSDTVWLITLEVYGVNGLVGTDFSTVTIRHLS